MVTHFFYDNKAVESTRIYDPISNHKALQNRRYNELLPHTNRLAQSLSRPRGLQRISCLSFVDPSQICLNREVDCVSVTTGSSLAIALMLYKILWNVGIYFISAFANWIANDIVFYHIMLRNVYDTLRHVLPFLFTIRLNHCTRKHKNDMKVTRLIILMLNHTIHPPFPQVDDGLGARVSLYPLYEDNVAVKPFILPKGLLVQIRRYFI